MRPPSGMSLERLCLEQEDIIEKQAAQNVGKAYKKMHGGVMKEIIFALIGGGFFAFIQFLITRYDNKHYLRKNVKKSYECPYDIWILYTKASS